MTKLIGFATGGNGVITQNEIRLVNLIICDLINDDLVIEASSYTVEPAIRSTRI